MSYFTNVSLDTNNPVGDAFGRLRVGNPETLFDSKQIFDNQPLFWDEELESGAGITSAHSVDTASTVITSSATTAGVFTRQTFMRFNYQPGKSQLVLMTGVFDRSGGGTGVRRRMGQFDDDNGLFFDFHAGTMKVVRRTKASGTVVDNEVAQSSWNLDKLDGTGCSGVTADWTKAQICVIDYEWLGVGRVRMGFNIDGVTIYVHEFLNANSLATVYMSTPNLPLRYQMVTTVSSPISTMECICASIISEGGSQDTGLVRTETIGDEDIDANTVGTAYAICGLRLKAANLSGVVKLVNTSLLNRTNDDFEWDLRLNPTVAGGGLTWTGQSNSVVEFGVGDTSSGGASDTTVTGGTKIISGVVKSGGDTGDVTAGLPNVLRLGAAIDGTRDELVLVVTPYDANADIYGGLTLKEFQ